MAAVPTTPFTKASAPAARWRGWNIGCHGFTAGWKVCSTICPGDAIVTDDHLDQVRDARWHMITEQFDARREALGRKGGTDTVYRPVPPGEILMPPNGSAGWMRTGCCGCRC